MNNKSSQHKKKDANEEKEHFEGTLKVLLSVPRKKEKKGKTKKKKANRKKKQY